MTVGAADYKAALRRHPGGVAVVTFASPAGPVGFTATSLTSLSLDPPLVCFNITRTSSSYDALCSATDVVVHLLGSHQSDLARRFSQPAHERFADRSLWTTLSSGEPLLRGTPVWLRATVQQLIPAGDSALLIGHVNRICQTDPGRRCVPLLYHDGRYASLANVAPETPEAHPRKG
jgi:flavin reductase (DIM6/NTAB) family NADH-FMN oxidoreductase RutF